MFALAYFCATAVSAFFIIATDLRTNTKVWFCAFLFGLIGLLFIPKIGSNVDALKYFDVLNHLRTIPKGDLFQRWQYLNGTTITTTTDLMATSTISFSSTPVMGVVMLIMSYFPNSFLLASVAFIDYFFVLKMMSLFVEKEQLSNREFAFGFIIFCCLFVFSAAVGGIRNNLVGTILGYVYLKLCYSTSSNGFHNFIWVSIISILLSLVHPFSLLLYSLMIIAFFFTGHPIIRLFDVLMVSERIFQPALISLFALFGSIPFFASIVAKSGQYLGKDATIHISSTANLVRDLMRLLVFLALFIIIQRLGKHLINHKYNELMILMFCLLIGSIQDQLLFDRILLVLLPLMAPYIIMLCSTVKTYCVGILTPSKIMVYLYFLAFNIYALICLIDNVRAGTLYYRVLFM